MGNESKKEFRMGCILDVANSYADAVATMKKMLKANGRFSSEFADAHTTYAKYSTTLQNVEWCLGINAVAVWRAAEKFSRRTGYERVPSLGSMERLVAWAAT